MIDIGANLLDPVFDADRREVLRRAAAAGIDAIVLTGTSVASSRAAADFASRGIGDAGAAGESSYDPIPGLFATAGVHPHDATAVEAGWDH
ncbi:MAG: TatD family hydrolase, partial [Gammaproteobacteria bacterium]|nr:TatD family hydrolase [Gammaproteobacteria bacterium]